MSAQTLVITSIFPPTAAVARFAVQPDWQVVVVADRRTPVDWHCPKVRCLTVADQRKLPYRIIPRLPWNHYARKMIGYLWAAHHGAHIIAESDDDNRPYDGWRFPPFEGEFAHVAEDRGFVNPYSLFTDEPIWPRGFPLGHLRDPGSRIDPGQLRRRRAAMGVWQALADGDPDVDAVFRLTAHHPCRFAPHDPVVLGPGTLAPFNSQNTAFHRALLPLMYLPAHVNFRVTDILRGWVAQPIMAAAGYRLGFASASVFQARNQHDFLDDFHSELPLFLETETMVAQIQAAVHPAATIADNLHAVYRALARIGAVPAAELDLLDAWLTDIHALAMPPAGAAP